MAPQGKRFKMKWSDNMTAQSKPEIKAAAKEDFTKISWVPDLAKFGMSAMDEDIVALMERCAAALPACRPPAGRGRSQSPSSPPADRAAPALAPFLVSRRAYDMAGCTHSSVKVYLNGKKLPVADFKSYVDLFLGPKQAADAVPRVFEKVGDRWEVAVAASEDGFAQVSFVNSIATSKGGTHVNHVADQVVDRVLEHLKKKHKGLEKAPNLPLQTTDSYATTDPAAAPTPAPVRPPPPGRCSSRTTSRGNFASSSTASSRTPPSTRRPRRT